ncbi:hypothetical protein D3C77_558440 [compost metagenome]
MAFLWANRLLPVELAQRAGWEVRVFFLVWLLSLLYACWRPYMRAWKEQLGLAAALCIGLPLLGLATLEQPWASAMSLSLELTSLALGVVLAWLAWRVGRRLPPEPRSPRRGATLQEAH